MKSNIELQKEMNEMNNTNEINDINEYLKQLDSKEKIVYKIELLIVIICSNYVTNVAMQRSILLHIYTEIIK